MSRPKVLNAVSDWSNSIHNRDFQEGEFSFTSKTGRQYCILIRGVPMQDKQGKTSSWLGINLDITERKQAESAMAKQKQIMARAESIAELGSWEWNIKDDTWLLSSNWKRIHGCSDVKLTTSQIIAIAHHEDRSFIEDAFSKVLEQGKPYEIEHRIVRQDTGEVRHVRAKGIVELDNSGKPMVLAGVVKDITDSKQARERIRLINQLERVNAEKDKLFAIIAHDLKSPLSGVLSSAEILAKEAEFLSLEEIQQISAAMYKSTQNSLGLLNDLMQWARMSQGGMDFSPEQCSLYELARTSLDTAQDVAIKKDITIQSDIPEDLTVLADQAMINTVIRNVIFNAVKFSHPGGKIFLTARKAGSDVEVCIQDEGIGMDNEVLSTIFLFDKNKRQYGTDGEKGTGLGLILCKEFVEKHNGQIWLESEPEKGTKVFFTLPSAS